MTKLLVILLSVSFQIVQVFVQCNKRLPYPPRGSRATLQSFIVGGTPASIEEFPHHLALLESGNYICGASVISDKWALSAGHCFPSQFPPEFYSLWGGSKSRLANGTVFDVESYIVHPKFDPYILDYDIAVIKITQTFRGVKNIQRAILANEACRTGSGARVRVVGWGLNDERILPEYLLQIKQYTLDQDACLKAWGSDITSRMICGKLEEGIDSCDGDSGGGIMKDCLLVAMVSFGSQDCGFGLPPVFTRIEDPGIRGFIRKHACV